MSYTFHRWEETSINGYEICSRCGANGRVNEWGQSFDGTSSCNLYNRKGTNMPAMADCDEVIARTVMES
jgi:hypothetical protein